MVTRERARPWRWLFAFVALAGLGFAAYWWCCRAPAPPVTGLTTLYSRDPLRHAMSFGTGGEGGAFSDGWVVNAGSDIDFGSYSENGFSVGIEGGREGRILDLGSPDSLQQRYGYDETAGGGQGFASIQLLDDKLVIRANDRSTQALEGVEGLFASSDYAIGSAPVVNDHIYLVRLTDGNDAAFVRLVKFYVVAYDPGESVTIRWFRLTG